MGEVVVEYMLVYLDRGQSAYISPVLASHPPFVFDPPEISERRSRLAGQEQLSPGRKKRTRTEPRASTRLEAKLWREARGGA